MPDGKDNDCDGGIDRVDQEITFEPITTQQLADENLTLIATSSSELPISYSIVEGNAQISQNIISFSSVGFILVQAEQVGDDRFNAALSVTQSFEVESITGMELSPSLSQVFIYPNPVKDRLVISGFSEEITHIAVTDINGKLLWESYGTREVTEIDTRLFENGNYFVKVAFDNTIHVLKFIKIE